jgi:hypothetical protein
VLPLLNTDGLKTQGLVHWLYLRKTADAQTSALSSLLNFCVKANASVATLLTQGKLVCEREWLPVRPIRGGRRRETRRRKVIGEGGGAHAVEGQVPSASRVWRLLGNSNVLRKKRPRAAFFEARKKLGIDGD